MQLNTSLDFFILQGSRVGASTVVSNMVLIRAENEVIAAWGQRGATIDLRRLRQSYDTIDQVLGARRMSEDPVHRAPSSSSEAPALGLSQQKMIKASGDCKASATATSAARSAPKSSLTTFIRWAEERGARVMADTNVERIVIKKGCVSHVEARTGTDGESLRIVAKKVVVSAGAIGSSALLLSSISA